MIQRHNLEEKMKREQLVLHRKIAIKWRGFSPTIWPIRRNSTTSLETKSEYN